jgi:hypothetical protein
MELQKNNTAWSGCLPDGDNWQYACRAEDKTLESPKK